MKKNTSKQSKIKYYISIVLAITILLLVLTPFSPVRLYETVRLYESNILSPDDCEYTLLSVSQIQTTSNVETLDTDKALLLYIRADKGSQCAELTVTQQDLNDNGLNNLLLLGNITLTAKINDLWLEYNILPDRLIYDIYESTITADLSESIPYNGVNLETTQKAALGQWEDPTGIAQTVIQLGNSYGQGDVNNMIDINKLAYVQRENSNIPYGEDHTGNWQVTHLGGIPTDRGYYISSLPFNKYSVKFDLTREGQQLGTATLTDQVHLANLGEIARIKSVGGSIESVFPPQPGQRYAIIQAVEGTPDEGRLKFVEKRRLDNYYNTLDELVNFDNNYFTYTWQDMDGSLSITSSDPGKVDVYLDNKYLGFTPLILTSTPVGQHTITARKQGYRELVQEIAISPTDNAIDIQLAKIPPPEIIITVTPATIVRGTSATLTWRVSGDVSSTTLYNPTPQTVTSTGSRTINPTQSTTYSIKAIGEGGEQTGSVRLAVSDPPLPPPPRISRDPGVGREILTDKENTLNNMLGLMKTSKVIPEDGCTINKGIMKVICRPNYPVTYPEFQVIIKASDIVLQLNAGLPQIDNIKIPTTIYESSQENIAVTFSNKGQKKDTFDLYLQSDAAISSGVQQFTLTPGEEITGTIPIRGIVGTHKARVVVISKNDPNAKAVKDITLTIIKKPLDDDLIRLQDDQGFLQGKILKQLSNNLKIGIAAVVLSLLSIVVVILRRKQ